MVKQNGAATHPVKQDLLAHGERYSYFQAIRLLRLFARSGTAHDAELRIRPKLSLAFPENDINQIVPRQRGGYQIEANFFGLYGVASPLPTYYTEDLLEEAREGEHASRDFFDIVNYTLYPLLYDAWRKHRLQMRAVEEGDSSALNLLYSFVGLADPTLRKALPYEGRGLLRYAGILNQRPRSALGLKTILSDLHRDAQVEVDCCVLRVVPIPADQRWQLGALGQGLGESLYLGEEVEECGNAIALRFRALPWHSYQALMPGGEAAQRLAFLTRFYLTEPLDVDVELYLRPAERQASQLGGAHWSRLGLDAWLNPAPEEAPACVRYSI